MNVHAWSLFGWAGLAALALFTLAWMASVKLDNYSFVDAVWSYTLGVLVLIYAIFSHGDPQRRGLAFTLAAIWSIRLGTYLIRRILRHHPDEDVRYAELRQRWKTNVPSHFLVVFLWQAILIWLLSLPHLVACSNSATRMGWIEWNGAAVVLAGILGEAIADSQMAAFKRAHQGERHAVCRAGLWRYSRHPNYFFEFITWIGVWIFASGSPGGWMTLHAPVLMLLFLYRVTGIPLTERHAIESKGAAYREYQATTSAFIPWFPKSSHQYP